MPKSKTPLLFASSINRADVKSALSSPLPDVLNVTELTVTSSVEPADNCICSIVRSCSSVSIVCAGGLLPPAESASVPVADMVARPPFLGGPAGVIDTALEAPSAEISPDVVNVV